MNPAEHWVPIGGCRIIRRLHLSVPVLRLGIRRSEDFEMPLPATPGLNHLSRNDVDENLGERSPFRVPVEVIGGLVPREARVEHDRQEQVVAVIDDDQLSAGTLQRRMVDEVLLGAVRADVALQRELARDDLFDGDLLVPAVAAVLLLAPRFGYLLRTAKGAPRLRDGLSRHVSDCSRGPEAPRAPQRGTCSPCIAGAYRYSTYCLTMRRALKRGPTVAIAWRTTFSQRCGIPFASRS